jgi:hypothetical protein
MTNETYNVWNIGLQIASALISAIVGWIIYWYARETKRLREATDAQVRLLTLQSARSVMPFAQPGFKSYDIDPATRAFCLTVEIQNPASASAFYVGIVVFNGSHWQIAAITITWIAAGASIDHSSPYRNAATALELRSILAEDYPALPEGLILCLFSEVSYVATISLDIHGRPYLVKRRIDLSSEQAVNFSAQMEYPESNPSVRNNN